VAEEEDNDYEPIESFDVLPESPDRFEDLMEHYRELEKVILVEDRVYSGEPNEWYCNSYFDEDLDLDSITILEEPEL
uniref:Uncharacterized protein n=1 Tax=Acrobeloides nanus TaxID=290746 RepID=A0A914DS34_9BILA